MNKTVRKMLGSDSGNISTVGKLGPRSVYQYYHIGWNCLPTSRN